MYPERAGRGEGEERGRERDLQRGAEAGQGVHTEKR